MRIFTICFSCFLNALILGIFCETSTCSMDSAATKTLADSSPSSLTSVIQKLQSHSENLMAALHRLQIHSRTRHENLIKDLQTSRWKEQRLAWILKHHLQIGDWDKNDESGLSMENEEALTVSSSTGDGPESESGLESETSLRWIDDTLLRALEELQEAFGELYDKFQRHQTQYQQSMESWHRREETLLDQIHILEDALSKYSFLGSNAQQQQPSSKGYSMMQSPIEASSNSMRESELQSQVRQWKHRYEAQVMVNRRIRQLLAKLANYGQPRVQPLQVEVSQSVSQLLDEAIVDDTVLDQNVRNSSSRDASKSNLLDHNVEIQEENDLSSADDDEHAELVLTDHPSHPPPPNTQVQQQLESTKNKKLIASNTNSNSLYRLKRQHRKMNPRDRSSYSTPALLSNPSQVSLDSSTNLATVENETHVSGKVKYSTSRQSIKNYIHLIDLYNRALHALASQQLQYQHSVAIDNLEVQLKKLMDERDAWKENTRRLEREVLLMQTRQVTADQSSTPTTLPLTMETGDQTFMNHASKSIQTLDDVPVSPVKSPRILYYQAPRRPVVRLPQQCQPSCPDCWMHPLKDI